jgi:protein TonB
MDFAQHQRNPTRHLVGIGGVVLLHIVIIYALMTGLARKVVEVVKGPIEVKVIEEVIKKPPPPPDVLPPPPKMAAPPPPFVAPQAPVIVKAPEAPPAPPPPAPTVRSASVACPNYKEVMQAIPYPREALLDNIQGEVVIEFTITGSGKVTDVIVKSSSNKVFNKAALNAVQNRLTCQGQGQDVRVVAPINFKIN